MLAGVTDNSQAGPAEPARANSKIDFSQLQPAQMLARHEFRADLAISAHANSPAPAGGLQEYTPWPVSSLKEIELKLPILSEDKRRPVFSLPEAP